MEYDAPPKTTKEALERGLTRFFTGKPCRYGHIVERLVSNGSCSVCLNERRNANRAKNYAGVKAWRQANPAARAEQSKRYAAAHPEKRKAASKRYQAKHAERLLPLYAERVARWRKENPEKNKARIEKWRLNREIKLADMAGRPRPQGCDLCGGNVGGIVFDHCHTSAKFRGWLCDQCNKVLGLVYDNPELLMKMAEYLGNHNGDIDRESTGETPVVQIWRAWGTEVSSGYP